VSHKNWSVSEGSARGGSTRNKGDGQLDVLILGAGPAGTATAIGCRTQGLSVRLIEPARFPRSAPGETLHPGVEPVLRQLGVWHELQRAMTIRPSGLLVRWARDTRMVRYGGPSRRPWRACQLLRAVLDLVLLDRARTHGAQVSQPCRPHGVLLADGRVRGVMTSEGAIDARVVVDATGRSAWLARRLGLAFEQHSPRLLTSYGYVESVRKGPRRLRFVADSAGWTWSARVLPQVDAWVRTTRPAERPPTDWAPAWCDGRAMGPVRYTDATWRLVTSPAGPGYLIVGDSAAILDPARSSGVLNALVSGTVAATTMGLVLAGGVSERDAHVAYTKYVRRTFLRDARSLSSWYSAFPWWSTAQLETGARTWH
jgi:flavin-dependent dehydrogenase